MAAIPRGDELRATGTVALPGGANRVRETAPRYPHMQRQASGARSHAEL